jgi:hypothetical protein
MDITFLMLFLMRLRTWGSEGSNASDPICWR